MTRRRAPDPLEGRLAALQALRNQPGQPDAPEAVAELRAALEDRSAHAIAKAAEIAGEWELTALEPELAAAFERLLVDPARTDKGCVGKTAVAEALVRIGAERAELYRTGAGHVQLEPVWGGRADTAARLRAACAMGLVRMADRHAYDVAAALLVDPEAPARMGAAEALGHGAALVATPLLRMKALAGDIEGRVVGECFASLLRLAPEASLPFVSGFLDARASEVQEAAAFALGESQLEGALAALRAYRERADDGGRIALLAIALLRRDDALDYLVTLVGTAAPRTARLALDALAAPCERTAVRERVLRAVQGREDAALAAEGEALRPRE
jgi:hypothetical protein